MPLILGKRNDAAAKERVDRSGLVAEDWALIALDNCWRGAHFAAVDFGEACRKLDRLTALLDDPALAATHPPDDPDRLDAQAKRAELWKLRDLHRAEFRREAKAAAKAWDDLPTEALRAWFAEGIAKAWDDSPALPLVGEDPGLPRLAFWRAVLVLVPTGRGERR